MEIITPMRICNRLKFAICKIENMKPATKGAIVIMIAIIVFYGSMSLLWRM